eukprot:861638-Amphidinium_carterae.1
MLGRRLQLIRTAHAANPGQPDYSMAVSIMGWGQTRLGVSPALQKHVAEEVKQQAAVAKESRKAREERTMGKGAGKGKPKPKEEGA